ncbi:TetR/AcrR family transcriptional regulator [Micromonospora endophytica]|uniref:TetR family transcriptional regulator n=1 Tax=Micromonospora endophytica TaxID=515350 RepID=A0A2W2E2M9_9ACTN|nr:TetR family transcriptional regulator [Micromonospora endophytica]PZF99203.1 TetR family transcriptional regulator [Micromonospora endophytica]RIW45068.1 TetR family transcriptional regulator [Micromonospora endophytica]BCJ58041.1 HTH-type transcriptional repressor [Micromonospora endophytica]
MARNPEATQASILAAARVEFAAYGLAGARVDRIAARSGYNKQRIYARFGDKEGLYQRVLSEMLEEMRLATVVREGEDVGDYVRKSFDYLSEHRELLRMLLWEALECDGEFVPDEAARRRCYGRSNAALAEHLGRTAGPDTARLLFTLIGITAWPSAFATLGRLVTDNDTATEEGQRALREFLVEFARSGVATANCLISADANNS